MLATENFNTWLADHSGLPLCTRMNPHLVLGEMHFHQGFGHLLLFSRKQAAQNLHSAKVFHILLELLLGDLHQDFLEVLTLVHR